MCTVWQWQTERNDTASWLIKTPPLPGWRLLSSSPCCVRVFVWPKMTWGCPLVVTSLSVSPAAPAVRPAVGAENRRRDWCPTAPGCNWKVSGWWLTRLFTLICCLHSSIQTTARDSGWASMPPLQKRTPLVGADKFHFIWFNLNFDIKRERVLGFIKGHQARCHLRTWVFDIHTR